MPVARPPRTPAAIAPPSNPRRTTTIRSTTMVRRRLEPHAKACEGIMSNAISTTEHALFIGCPPFESLRRFCGPKVYRSVPSLLLVRSPMPQAFVQCLLLLRRKFTPLLVLLAPLQAFFRGKLAELFEPPL